MADQVRREQPDAPAHMDPKVRRLMKEIAISEGTRPFKFMHFPCCICICYIEYMSTISLDHSYILYLCNLCIYCLQLISVVGGRW